MNEQPIQGVLALPEFASTEFTIQIIEALKAQGWRVQIIATQIDKDGIDSECVPALHCMRAT